MGREDHDSMIMKISWVHLKFNEFVSILRQPENPLIHSSMLKGQDMALAHNLGFPHIGRDRELRARHWQVQKDAGIELLPVGDFAWDSHVLSAGDQPFVLNWEPLFEEVEHAKALGHEIGRAHV